MNKTKKITALYERLSHDDEKSSCFFGIHMWNYTHRHQSLRRCLR
ncbi:MULTISPECIES: hypothetical protein [unclassified Neglectibacter]|nr:MULTISPECIES: hypothetical protein [unclassified Neglectibacter]